MHLRDLLGDGPLNGQGILLGYVEYWGCKTLAANHYLAERRRESSPPLERPEIGVLPGRVGRRPAFVHPAAAWSDRYNSRVLKMESQLQNPEDRVAGPRSPLLENGRRTLTAKGRATRQRIIDAAARVMVEAGPDGARLEDIQAEARVSVSQVYHYFRDKDALILAVVDHQTEVVLGAHRPVLERLDSFERLEEWRDMIVAGLEAQRCIGGCPVGSLASSLAESHPIARTALANSFARWEALLRDGLARMRDQGALRADIDVDSLALGTLAAVQGGLLLSQTRRDTSSVRIAVDNAIALLRTLSP